MLIDGTGSHRYRGQRYAWSMGEATVIVHVHGSEQGIGCFAGCGLVLLLVVLLGLALWALNVTTLWIAQHPTGSVVLALLLVVAMGGGFAWWWQRRR